MRILSEHVNLLRRVLLWFQAIRDRFADLAMSIFMKDPPNDPKTLYETREQGSIKLTSLGMTSKPKASKHEVW